MSVQIRAVSLGVGVQSVTLCLMAAHGEIEPMPDCAIFADTQWERRVLYEYLTWLRSPNVLPFPVHQVAKGNLRQAIIDRRNTTGGRFAAVPWFIRNPDGTEGMGRRQCTAEYKLAPVMWKLRELLGKGRRERIPAGAAEVWIGISTERGRPDEAFQLAMAGKPLSPHRAIHEPAGLCGLAEAPRVPSPREIRLHRLPVPRQRILARSPGQSRR